MICRPERCAFRAETTRLNGDIVARDGVRDASERSERTAGAPPAVF
jgi:hypothetical protein